MAERFNPNVNIPLGTFVQDGVRTGSLYNDISSTVADTNGNLIVNNYNLSGPGILLSTQNTYQLVPYASTTGNIVATAAIAAAGYLTLTQDTLATTTYTNVDGNTAVRFDWPRVPSVTVAGAAMAASTRVTIFGYDAYNFPLQHTYVVQAQGTYPADLSTPAKAFWGITGVYSDGATGVGGTLSVETTNIFGLPYRLNSYGDVMKFSWDGEDMKDQYGVATLTAGTVTIDTPAVVSTSNIQLTYAGAGANKGILNPSSIVDNTSFDIDSSNGADANNVNWLIVDGGANLIAPADTTTATATSGDIRGLFQVPTAPDGTITALFTMFVEGANTRINQLAAGNQPQFQTTNPQTVRPLTIQDLVGVSQFYTGSPS